MKLQVFQAMWGMEQLPYRSEREWSLEERVDRIADAGFDGALVEFDALDEARRTTELLRERGLRWAAACFPWTVDELHQTIDWVVECGVEHCDHINLQPRPQPDRVLECVPLVLGWQAIADQAGLPLHIETHRDRMTTDLIFTLELVEAIPPMKLTADLSHFLVGREFRYPVGDEEHAKIRRILERTWGFHGRVATREQVQVQISFPHQRLWLDLFLDWWEEGFRIARARDLPNDATLTFTPELGPPAWYAMTGPDGREMSDRWQEALTLQQLVRDLWARLETEANEPRP
jgi:hypothetical protein